MEQRPTPTDSQGEVRALVEALRQGSRRALARAITYVENYDPRRTALLQALPAATDLPYIVGITGTPGAGKSSLIGALAGVLRHQGRRVGIVAVDPDSPLTGGAVLGDRIRMPLTGRPPGVFFRSMASRGQLGGMSRSVRSVVHLLDAFGNDVILVETVGAGQSDVAVRTIAHSTAVVSVPGLGDDIQMLKAGILEIADVYVVNKADREGADKTAAEIETMLKVGWAAAQEMGQALPDDAWRPPIVRTVATKGTGADRLADAFDEHRRYLMSTGRWDAIVRRQTEAELQEALLMQLEQSLADGLLAAERSRLIDAVQRREMAAVEAARRLLENLRDG